MKLSEIFDKAINLEFLNQDEAVFLYKSASLSTLSYIANYIKNKIHAHNRVGWIIDRNVNITNVCIGRCKFCNFHKLINRDGTYITSIEEYVRKIEELFALGGDQLLLQGGMHPKLGLPFYEDLFSSLKKRFPTLKLHALGPPEVAHLARLEKMSYTEVLEHLVNAGLDSLPGAGAEILVDSIRKTLSPGKCNSDTWLEIMEVAHKMQLTTSATMMFGHIESIDDRITHILKIRNLQAKSLSVSEGFTAFIIWPFQGENTILSKEYTHLKTITNYEYIKMLSLCRILLPNIKNIQASWLTVGIEAGMQCLHSGANDMGSIMIEENVVSAAGSHNTINGEKMISTIQKAGFEPVLRNQKYEITEIFK